MSKTGGGSAVVQQPECVPTSGQPEALPEAQPEAEPQHQNGLLPTTGDSTCIPDTGAGTSLPDNERFRDMTGCYPVDPFLYPVQTLDEDISGPQYAVLRITCDKILECRNTFNKYRAIIANYGGVILGIGEKVHFLEEQLRKWRHNHSVVVVWFPSRSQTTLWWQSMPEVRQQDWLHDGADVVVIPARPDMSIAPPSAAGCILLSDMHFIDPMYMDAPFRPDYDGEASQKMKDQGILVGLASTAKIEKKRGNWDPNFVTLHHFPTRQKILDFYNAADYEETKKVRQERASSDILYFDLTKL